MKACGSSLLSAIDFLRGERITQFAESEAEQRAHYPGDTRLQSSAEPLIFAEKYGTPQQEIGAFQRRVPTRAAVPHFGARNQQNPPRSTPDFGGEVRVADGLSITGIDLPEALDKAHP